MVSKLNILPYIRKLWPGQESPDGRMYARTDTEQPLKRLCRAHRKRAR